MAEKALSAQEFEERKAILKRLRQLLQEQRAKFEEYLDVLEKQENAIQTENVDAISAQAEIEQQIVHNITCLQKVIHPIETLYKKAYPNGDVQIVPLKADLAKLQTKVLAKNEHNRELLKKNIVIIRNQLAKIKNPYANRKSIFSTEPKMATLIDVLQ